MCKHSVHFYDAIYPADEAGDFIAAGLRAGDTCVLMLQQPHRAAVEQRLKDLGAAGAPQGTRPARCITIDTAEVLSELVVDGQLDLEKSAQKMGRLLSQAGGGGRVRLVGDPAALLLEAGSEEDANALEDLVAGLLVEHDAEVFCAYPLQGFFRRGSTASLFRTSAHHTRVAFPAGLWIRGCLEAGPGLHDAARH